FFQAEDGIRDFHVTGVQTCALPISKPIDLAKLEKQIALSNANETQTKEIALDVHHAETKVVDMSAHQAKTKVVDMSRLPRVPPRSEERRVGKSVDLGGRRHRKETEQ